MLSRFVGNTSIKNVERMTYNIIVTWRETETSFDSLDKDDFETTSRNMINDGFDNLRIEWYEKGDLSLPDLITVFVYWEDPDVAPEYELVRKWGRKFLESLRD